MEIRSLKSNVILFLKQEILLPYDHFQMQYYASLWLQGLQNCEKMYQLIKFSVRSKQNGYLDTSIDEILKFLFAKKKYFFRFSLKKFDRKAKVIWYPH